MSCLVNKSLFEFDKKFLNGNIKYILGTDEAGRGPGAGDVYASCVCFKSSFFSADKNLLEKLNVLMNENNPETVESQLTNKEEVKVKRYTCNDIKE